MKKGTITLKQLQKLYKEVAHTPSPTKLYEVGGTPRMYGRLVCDNPTTRGEIQGCFSAPKNAKWYTKLKFWLELDWD